MSVQHCGEIVMSLTMIALVIIPFAILIGVIAMNTAQTARASDPAEANPRAAGTECGGGIVNNNSRSTHEGIALQERWRLARPTAGGIPQALRSIVSALKKFQIQPKSLALPRFLKSIGLRSQIAVQVKPSVIASAIP